MSKNLSPLSPRYRPCGVPCVEEGGRVSGFSLLELLLVMSGLVLVLSIGIPTMGKLGAPKLRVTGAEIAGLLSEVRSDSISTRKVHGLGVVLDSTADPALGYRALVRLVQDPQTGTWQRHAPLFRLPETFYFDPGTLPYLAGAAYETREPRVVSRSTSLAAGTPFSVVEPSGDTLEVCIVRFNPSGRAYYENDDQNLAAHFVLVQAAAATTASSGVSLVYQNPDSTGSAPANWVQVSIDHLTGRARLFQP